MATSLRVHSLAEAYADFLATMHAGGGDVPEGLYGLTSNGSRFTPLSERLAFALARAVYVRDRYEVAGGFKASCAFAVERVLKEEAAPRQIRSSATKTSASKSAFLTYIGEDLFLPELWRKTTETARGTTLRLRGLETNVNDAATTAKASPEDAAKLLALFAASRYGAACHSLMSISLNVLEDIRQEPKINPISPGKWQRALRYTRPPTVATAYEYQLVISHRLAEVAANLHEHDHDQVRVIVESISLLTRETLTAKAPDFGATSSRHSLEETFPLPMNYCVRKSEVILLGSDLSRSTDLASGCRYQHKHSTSPSR